MLTVFNQVMMLFLFALVGFALSRSQILKPEHAQMLSALEVYVFLPCTIVKTFSANFSVEYLTQKYAILLIGIVILTCVILLSLAAARLFSKEVYERNVFIYSLIVPNMGYMGYALAEALYGSGTLLNVMIFGLPLNFFTYTAGYCLLTRKKLSFKNLINPVMIAVVCGCILGLSGLQIPTIATNALETGSACMAPISMILAGITISEFKFKELLGDIRMYIVTLLRLLIIPAAITLVLKAFGAHEVALLAVLAYAMPCGLNTIVFPKLIGEDCRIGASLALLSNVGACLTIPICLYLCA